MCGKEGTVRNDLGWISVLCEEHYRESKVNRVKSKAKEWVSRSIENHIEDLPEDDESYSSMKDMLETYKKEVLFCWSVKTIKEWTQKVAELFDCEERIFLENEYWKYILENISFDEYWTWYSEDEDLYDMRFKNRRVDES